MLDPVTVPLLLKSVDFLFGEYSKLLEERRKRREEKDDVDKGEKELTMSSTASPKRIRSKDDALKTPVEPALWNQKEDQVQHLVTLLEIHYQNYRLLSKQYAQWTAALVPPVIVSSLAREESEIEEVTQKLRGILAEVYDNDVQLEMF